MHTQLSACSKLHGVQVKIYEDEDGARKEEIAALANKDNPFAAFYDRLKEVREYHRRFPSNEVTEVGAGVHSVHAMHAWAVCAFATGAWFLAWPAVHMYCWPSRPDAEQGADWVHAHKHGHAQAETDEHLLKEEPHIEFTGAQGAACKHE